MLRFFRGRRPWITSAKMAMTACAVTGTVILQASAASAARDPFAEGSISEEREFDDPFEPLNRKVFEFNLKTDKYLFRPLAEGYRFIVHPTLRQMVRNALRNMRAPGSMANHLLQGDPEKAAYTFWGFLINSTFGVAGVMPVMEASGVNVEREDFGQTLAVWGVPTGGYIVLPFLGPSSGRDLFGFIADRAMDPFTYVGSDYALPAVATGVESVSAREAALEATDELESAALFDLYAAYRSAYLQRRVKQIKE